MLHIVIYHVCYNYNYLCCIMVPRFVDYAARMFVDFWSFSNENLFFRASTQIIILYSLRCTTIKFARNRNQKYSAYRINNCTRIVAYGISTYLVVVGKLDFHLFFQEDNTFSNHLYLLCILCLSKRKIMTCLYACNFI